MDCMDTALWQPASLDARHLLNDMGMGMVNPSMESMMAPSNKPERRPRPHKEQPLSCPRCHSSNTKFCYYNNYSLSQPRYFCKTCRRYWTEGGSLRNVPVGGGSRKNKKHIPTVPSSSSSRSYGSALPRSSPDLLLPPKFHDELSPFASAFGFQDCRVPAEMSFPLEAVSGDGVFGGVHAETAQMNADLGFEGTLSQAGEVSGLWNGLVGGCYPW
ncbi:uncharacterized protein LOC144710701 isoform X2 [Wolffia australiana]